MKPRPADRPSRKLSVCLAAILLLSSAARAQDDEALPEWFGEPNSPEDIQPSSVTYGLSNRRAIPELPAPDEPDTGYVPLYRLTRPYYDTIFSTTPPQYLPAPDPSSFRPVLAYRPPIGLQPRFHPDRLVEFHSTFGVSQAFDSNVNLTPANQVRDFYITPRMALELQIGTPDSAWIENYDTIIGLHSSYEAYGDLFYENPRLSAFNQKLDLNMRIGRSSAIWRPYFYFSQLTGTDLLTTELTNRTERIRISPASSANTSSRQTSPGTNPSVISTSAIRSGLREFQHSPDPPGSRLPPARGNERPALGRLPPHRAGPRLRGQ